MVLLRMRWSRNISLLAKLRATIMSVAMMAIFARAVSAQDLMSIVTPEEYEQLVDNPLDHTRGAAIATGFSDAFKHLHNADFERAQREMRRQIEQAESRNDAFREAVARDFQGLIFQRQGQLDDALQRHGAAMDILAKLKDGGEEQREAWANAANNLAVVYFLKGNYHAAAARLDEVIRDSQVGRNSRARARNNRGLVTHELGDYDKAQDYFGRAAADASERRLKAQLLNNQARAIALEGRPKDAYPRLEEAQALARQIKDSLLEANILDSWGEVLLRAKQPKEGLTKLDEARRLEKVAQAPMLRLTIQLNRGRALAALYENDLAAAEYGSVIKDAASARLAVMQRDGLVARGDLFHQSGKLNDAIDDYKTAVAIAQAIQAQNRGNKETERQFLEASRTLYDKVTRTLLRRNGVGDVQEALKYVSQSKSEELSRELARQFAHFRDQDVTDKIRGAQGILAREAALNRELLAASSALFTRTQRVEQLKKELDTARHEFQRAYGEIAQKYGDRFGEFVGISPLDFGTLGGQLPDGHLVVTFLPTDDGLYVFLVAKNSGVEFRQNQKITRRQLHEKIAAYRELVTNVRGQRSDYRIDSWDDPKWSALRQSTTELYEAVLQPIADRIAGARHIIFAPSGALHYLPLHALGSYDRNKKQLRFLIQDKAVSYVTTATLLKVAIGAAKRPERSLLALGNPRFKHPGLKPLPNAEEEVVSLGKLFGNNAAVLTGQQATREAFLTMFPAPARSLDSVNPRGATRAPARKFGYVHLATHGVLNAQAPSDSWLAMDGTKKLLAREVPALMDLRDVNLVTLSACETALAEERPGGELLNMAAYFNAAHASSIIVSLWSIDDQPTQELILAFYHDLLQPKMLDKSRALQAAVTKMVAKSETRHPYFWAPLILIGDWR